MKKVGIFSEKIIKQLDLNIIPGTPIYIGVQNEEHIQSRHPYEYEAYFNKLPDIIENPDYIGINPKDNSIQYVKEFLIYSEYIRVAIRITCNGTAFVKTLHLLNSCNAERYIEKGTLKKLDSD